MLEYPCPNTSVQTLLTSVTVPSKVNVIVVFFFLLDKSKEIISSLSAKRFPKFVSIFSATASSKASSNLNTNSRVTSSSDLTVVFNSVADGT